MMVPCLQNQNDGQFGLLSFFRFCMYGRKIDLSQVFFLSKIPIILVTKYAYMTHSILIIHTVYTFSIYFTFNFFSCNEWYRLSYIFLSVNVVI